MAGKEECCENVITRKRQLTRIALNRLREGNLVIGLGEKLLGRGLCTKVMVWNSITSGSTGQAVWLGLQLVSYLGTRIGLGSLNVSKYF